MVKRGIAPDCNMQVDMYRALHGFAILLLLACTSRGDDVSERERSFLEIATQKSREVGYPVLSQLPSSDEVTSGEDPAGLAPSLRRRAEVFSSLDPDAAATADALETGEVVSELEALVAGLRAGTVAPPPPVDVRALEFPTPPPLE